MTRKNKHNQYATGVACAILATAIFGFYGIITRSLNDSGFTILQQVYLRLAISSVLAMLIFRRHISITKLLGLPRKEWVLLAVRGLATYLLGVTLFSMALIHTKVGTAALMSTLPLVPVAGFLFFGEKLTIGKILCTLGAFGGAFLIAINDLSNPLSWGKGELLAFISVIGFTIAFIGRKWHSSSLNNREMTTIMLAFGFLGVLTAAVIGGETLPRDAGWNSAIVGLLLLAGAINVLNMLLINYIFQVLSNVLAGNLLMLEALFGILCGYLIYGEVLSVRQGIGGALLLVSVVWLNAIESRFAAVPVATT